jgi:hypothetical protein
MHGVVALLDGAMILLQLVVERVIASMEKLVAQRLANGTRLGRMAIGRHLFRDLAYHFNGLVKKTLRCLHISLLAEH